MQQKIIVMTQLALYDKHEGAADQIANDYFRHDYIYRKNLATRFAVGFGGFILLLLYWARNLLMEDELFAIADLFDIDFSVYITDSIFFILAILAVYSLIGTIQGTREYYLVQKRLTRYHALVRQLERINERAKKAAHEKAQEDAENEVEKRPPRPPRPLRRPVIDETENDEDEDLARTRRVETLPLAPPVYKNPFPPTTRPAQRSKEEPDGTDTARPRNPD
ncbi:MAG: hypothetical protein FWC16_00820 [Defluviitaleaceae bacterium]|nr:hypothetical protein [Defluviitaleaceae bacterium]MCL2273447.1 hypothetical protein [Defluviitaleaceae bacterium]